MADRYLKLSRALSNANRLLNTQFMPRGAYDGKEPPELDVAGLRKALQAAIDCLPEAGEDERKEYQNDALPDPADHRRDFRSGDYSSAERDEVFARARDSRRGADSRLAHDSQRVDIDELLGLKLN